jgi:hypothetical protein
VSCGSVPSRLLSSDWLVTGSELLSLTVKTIQQRQAPLPGSPAKRISEKELQFHYFLLLCTFARVPAGAFLFNLI